MSFVNVEYRLLCLHTVLKINQPYHSFWKCFDYLLVLENVNTVILQNISLEEEQYHVEPYQNFNRVQYEFLHDFTRIEVLVFIGS